jgi:hypothetical protein
MEESARLIVFERMGFKLDGGSAVVSKALF